MRCQGSRACGAIPVLESAREYGHMRDAVADLSTVYATTARLRDAFGPDEVLSPSGAAHGARERLCRGERVCFDNVFYECGYGGGGLTWSTVYSDHACVFQPLSEWCGSLSEWSAPPPPPDPRALNALRLGAGVSLPGAAQAVASARTGRS